MSTWSRRSGIQLAYPYEPHCLTKWSRPLLVQPKLNGNRCRALLSQQGITLLSSEENEIFSVPHIVEALNSLPKVTLELDGELYVHGMSKQAIDSITGRTKNIHPDCAKMQFHIFDLVAESVQQYPRLGMLYTDLRPHLDRHPCLQVVDTHRVETVDEVAGLFHSYVSEGYEGIIVRNPDSYYLRKRTNQMLKWKARAKDSYLIVGYTEEVDQYGTPKGRLGSLTCEKDRQQFNVGSGTLLTHQMREILWAVRDTLPGRYALILYPELTERGVPSHPTIIEITSHEVPDVN
jgi:ATP-dependent DNA ligase